MQLYKWKSEYLKNYRPGLIVVMAENMEQARAAAITAFIEYAAKYLDDYGFEDERDADYARLKTTFDADISAEPEIIVSGVLLIAGSD